jgi:hypothetical protein
MARIIDKDLVPVPGAPPASGEKATGLVGPAYRAKVLDRSLAPRLVFVAAGDYPDEGHVGAGLA